MNNILFAVSSKWRPRVFSDVDEKRIGDLGNVLDVPSVRDITKEFLLEHIQAADIVITSWETSALDAEVMAAARNLKLLAHAAGSVKPVVSDALWARGVRVTSAAAAIAFGVAEFCLGLILTATKRAFWGGLGTRQGLWTTGIQVFNGPTEIYQQKVGVIGAGHVGRHLIRLLKNFTCDVLLYDPYCPAEKASELGATKVESLDELFARCLVVSLNAPSTDRTRNMIRGKHLAKLQPGAVFINTARGAIVNEREMIEELRKGRFVACLDVTDPEPPSSDSPLRALPNVWLTPHEAGAVAQNLLRIGTFVADEIEEFCANKPGNYEVTREQLEYTG